MYAMGVGLACYFTPIHSVSSYLGISTKKNNTKRPSETATPQAQPEQVQFRTKRKRKRNDRKKRKEDNKRWGALIAVALVTSVFYGGYYIFGKYRYNLNVRTDIKQSDEQCDDEDDEENAEIEEDMSGLSYLMSFFYRNEDYDDEDLPLNAFGFLKRKRSDSNDNDYQE